MFSLDVANSNQVSSANAIIADLGIPNKRMLVCSGIAIPEWNVFDDGNIYHETAVVNLRQTAMIVDQFAINVGLASFGNGNTNFDFAIDATSLQVDETTQNLLLSVDMALMGNPSALDRFAYQVVAIVTFQPTGISGTIRWNQSLFDASVLPSARIPQLFNVSAGTKVTAPSSGGGFGATTYTPQASGTTGALSLTNGVFSIPYNIPGAPYGVNLVVQVGIGSLFSPGGYAEQVAGPNPIDLTTSEPGVSGVDFFIPQAPR